MGKLVFQMDITNSFPLWMDVSMHEEMEPILLFPLNLGWTETYLSSRIWKSDILQLLRLDHKKPCNLLLEFWNADSMTSSSLCH